MRVLRYVPWLLLFLAAWAFGAAAAKEWWTVPTIMVASFAIAMLFVRLGLHRIR